MSIIICPKCGKDSKEKDFINAFCIDCYQEQINIKIPEEIVLEICKTCEKIRSGREWVVEFDIQRYIIRKCKGDFFNAIFDEQNSLITFFIKKGEKVLKINKLINLKIIKSQCTDCSRKSGGYYEATIQLRGNKLRIEKYSKIFQRELSMKTFVNKIEERDSGIDLYIGSTDAVLEILKELRITHIITKKLFGVKQGKKVFRTTFSIRL